MVQPIFVLGLNRNGTTWLQNILCNHPEIIGAQHKAHWGIKESNICQHIRYWGDFENDDQFIRFLELYSSGDHFKLAEGEKEYFYQNRPKDFIEFFFEMMDNYANKKDVKYWTTKPEPLFFRHPRILKNFLKRATNRYEEIKFIGIKRNYIKALYSSLNMQNEFYDWRKKKFNKEIFSLY